MSIENEKDLEALKQIGKIVAIARDTMINNIRSGMTTKTLDDIGKNVLERYGAASAPKKDYRFPGTTCISINHEIAHGIPSQRIIKDGDIINVDVSAELNSYYADTGASVVVGQGLPIKHKLCECAQNALFKAIQSTRSGVKISQIGRAISNESKQYGFSVIKNLTGHGIGRKLHEEPDYILNYYDNSDKRILTEGLVLAVETFISSGADYVIDDSNGWTLKTPDRSFGAQFEHTIVVTKNTPIILTIA